MFSADQVAYISWLREIELDQFLAGASQDDFTREKKRLLKSTRENGRRFKKMSCQKMLEDSLVRVARRFNWKGKK